MTGTIDTESLAAIRDSSIDTSQSSMFDFAENDTNATTIAVVREPNDTGILNFVDEWCPELGMPKHKLDSFRNLKYSYNSRDPVESHNNAYEKCNLDESFESHVQYNEDAQAALADIVERVQSGENITLVCFEESPKKCHRHLLKEIIEEELQQTAPQ